MNRFLTALWVLALAILGSSTRLVADGGGPDVPGGGCTKGCFLFTLFNDSAGDWQTDQVVCIDVAVTGTGSKTCPVQKNLTGNCAATGNVNKSMTSSCRCCSYTNVSGGTRAQDFADAVNCPAANSNQVSMPLGCQ